MCICAPHSRSTRDEAFGVLVKGGRSCKSRGIFAEALRGRRGTQVELVALMHLNTLLALAASSVLVLGATGCAIEGGAGDEGEAVSGDDALAQAPATDLEPKEQMLWTKQFPVNPSGTPAAESAFDVREMNGCIFTAVTHGVANQRAVGIKVEPVSKLSCAITNALGGTGYLGIKTYNGPVAHARLDTYAPLGRIAFTHNGSSGPYAGAASTMPALSVMLIRASSGATIRSTKQGLCGGGPGSQIVPTGAISVDPATGLFSIGGTKNQPSGLPGDTCMGGGAYLASFTLKYTSFASGAGDVGQPTIE